MALNRIIQKRIISCSPDSDLQSVARLMRDEDVGAVVVVEGGNPVGIVTDRDLVVRCLCDQSDCSSMLVKDIMSRRVQTVPGDAGIQKAIDCMEQSGVRRVVIVDSKGKAVGLLSFGDMVSLLSKELNQLCNLTASGRQEHKAA